MDYQTFQPHPDLESLISCYWTLEVPANKNTQKQQVVPDGFIEMVFILRDDLKRYTSEDESILQPREMFLRQTIEPFVNTLAIRFYPYGFENFVAIPIKNLVNKPPNSIVIWRKTS